MIGVALVRPGGQLRDGIDRAERVRDVGAGDELDAPALLDLGERVEDELARVVDRNDRELGAGALRDVLPGHEVRVVLELGRDDHVTGAEVVEPPRVGDQVEALGAVADEDDLANARRVQERPHLLARALVAGSRALAELVDRPMDVGVRRRRRTRASRRAPAAASARSSAESR